MSAGATNAMKVSREGVILIKSFEGFRPRAVQRADGRWVIGYGHTASARDGLSVGEGDAELLLQYDLIPVVRTLNDQVEPDLNQHQFDALASFVFSIGVDRFVGSDLFTQLNAGETTQAADALTAWADDSQAETPIRRRAAERALFIAEPGAPVALADLLAAPIPLPPANPVIDRATAVAALLGEDDASAEADVNETPETPAEVVAEPPVEAEPAPGPAPKPSLAASAAFNLYSPYRIAAIGPLPGFPPPSAPARANDDAVVESDPVVATETPPPVEPEATVELAPQSEPVVETPSAEVITPVFPQASANFAPPMIRVETPTFTPAPALSVATEAEPVIFGEDTPPLVLTSPEPTVASPFDRIAWPDADRAPQVDEPVLFDEAAVLEHLAIRSDTDALPPRRFDWSETGLFLVMGGIGLVSFGAAMAAFRRASEVEGGGDTALIGWVLAVIALACVSVSGFNLYQRFGRADRD